MKAFWIFMRPVYYTTLLAPLILTIKPDFITFGFSPLQLIKQIAKQAIPIVFLMNLINISE
jgi:hypothetical protein